MDGMWQGHRRWLRHGLTALAMLTGSAALPAAGAAHMQCVPYARQVSGIAIYGDAHLWWHKAQQHYDRGEKPRVGAVLAFRATSAMPLGHVAVVGQILDDRRILLDHANWSGPGMIEQAALAEDVSVAGDWSMVRVWYAPIGALGARTNPAYGFIYNDPINPGPTTGTAVASAEGQDMLLAGD